MAEKFVDRQSAYPNRYKITRADGSTEYITLERADEPVVVGTPLNAETFNGIFRWGTVTGDLNDVKAPGWYWVRTADCTNTPLGDNFYGAFGYLEVIVPPAYDGDLLQRFTQYTSGKTWVRDNVNGWKSWVRVGKTLSEHLTEEDLVLTPVKHYGDAFPPAGTTGRIFFKKVSS
jgi:hypothetical protein